MLMSHHHNAKQNHNLKTAKNAFKVNQVIDVGE
jgi:hypothetical protein